MKQGQNSLKIIFLVIAIIVLLTAIVFLGGTEMGDTQSGWKTFLEGFNLMKQE